MLTPIVIGYSLHIQFFLLSGFSGADRHKRTTDMDSAGQNTLITKKTFIWDINETNCNTEFSIRAR